MAYEIRSSRRVVRELADLRSIEPAFQRLLERVFERLIADPRPDGRGIKKLKNRPEYAVRITRRYRLVFQVQDQVVVITGVGHRREVYRRRS